MLLLLHLGLIFWLARRSPIAPALPAAQLRVTLPSDPAAAMVGLMDPTLFALPNRRGFSGPVWMNPARPDRPVTEWTEPPRYLALRPGSLGATLEASAAAIVARPFEVAGKPAPRLDLPEIPLAVNLAPTASTLRVEGELAKRTLLSLSNQPAAGFTLPAWPPAAGEVLTNSVVRLLVNNEGRVFSPVLLTGCGSPAADAAAMALAKSARFQPAFRRGPVQPNSAAAPLTTGRMVFHWLTIPGPATNAVSVGGG